MVKFKMPFLFSFFRGGRYTEEDAKSILVQILNVVAFCHLQGVVHRDLKPENFLFTKKEEDAPMKVIDFGLSDFIRPGNDCVCFGKKHVSFLFWVGGGDLSAPQSFNDHRCHGF